MYVHTLKLKKIEEEMNTSNGGHQISPENTKDWEPIEIGEMCIRDRNFS